MKNTGIQKLICVVGQLRDPQNGCPWDLEQTHASLMPYFFEELHEFSEALSVHGIDAPETFEELGDVLYQVVIHTQLSSERGGPGFDALAGALAEKLIARHPHVFDPAFGRFKSSAEVNRNWERIKAHARLQSGAAAPPSNPAATASATASATPSADQIASVPRSLPALQRAGRLGEKAAAFDFDWAHAQQILNKVDEELAELKADVEEPALAREELGDLFFVLAQYARKRQWDPEQILAAANEKFIRRLRAVETLLEAEGLKFATVGTAQLEAAWQRVKLAERAGVK